LSKTRKALALSFLERYTSIAIYASSSAVMSRILTPQDIGLFSVGFAVTALVSQFRDFGVATYLIQETDLTVQKVRAALGMSIVTSLVVGLVLIGASGVVSQIYHQPGVRYVIIITCISLIFIPFTSIVTMWLRRQMMFGVLYRISIVGALAQTIVTVGLGLHGWGYLSMAWGSVANSVGIALAAARYWPREFGFLPSFRSWRPIASLGFYSTVGNLGEEITPRSADLFIGRMAGMASLGQFSRAISLVNFVSVSLVSASLPVALSVFALRRRANEGIQEAYLTATSYITVIVWPVFVFTAMMSFQIIRILFGHQWDIAVLPARILALGGLVATLTAIHPAVFQAVGAMKQRMYVQLIMTPIQVVVFFVAAHFGLAWVALASVISSLVEFVSSQIAVNRIANVNMGDILESVMGSFYVSIGSAILPLLLLTVFPTNENNVIVTLVLASLLATIGWLSSVYALKHPIRSEVTSTFALLRSHIRRFT
jgi:O-antigen/teichoic acid export membrane protein